MIVNNKKGPLTENTARPKSRDVPSQKRQRKWAISRTYAAHWARFVPVLADAFRSVCAKSV